MIYNTKNKINDNSDNNDKIIILLRTIYKN